MGELLKDILDSRIDLRCHLFERGFFVTDDKSIKLSGFPLYNDCWSEQTFSRYRVFVHKGETLYSHEKNGTVYLLFGHAYNPYSMESAETDILFSLSSASESNSFYDKLNELTGIFVLLRITDQHIIIDTDASAMQYCCYTTQGNNVYIASHMRLIGDILSLETDDYVKKLINYRWYRYMMGNYLPGDMTAFSNVKHALPNTTVSIDTKTYASSITRFYPCKPLKMCETDNDYNEVIKEASAIFQNTMKLITMKWERPAISLTGGIDSNTTFAAANGLYDKFTSFSYVSLPREQVDADAAKRICDKFSVDHRTYNVPSEPQKDFDEYKMIFLHNDGEIGTCKDNDVRKRIMLINECDVDVEVKSWISETIRAYAYKYYGRTKLPKVLRPRHYTSLYKVFLANRSLALMTDKCFAKYIDDTKIHEHIFNYDESDFFVWEMMHGGKCALNIGVMKSCFNITIPYNNRNLIDLLLRVQLKDRIDDRHHLDLKKTMNKELYDMNLRVVNLNETKERKRAINLYYNINTHIPF